jgi:hypothetical protein
LAGFSGIGMSCPACCAIAGGDQASANAPTVAMNIIFTNFSPPEWGVQRVGAPPVQLLGVSAMCAMAAPFGAMTVTLVGHVLAAILAAILHLLLVLLGRHLPVSVGRGRRLRRDGRGDQHCHHCLSPEFDCVV